MLAVTVGFFDNICVMGWPNGPARTLTSELSGGMKKRAGAARALAMDPELLFSMNQPPG
jgi:ABC-type transporter Mla maintaining outer membrane lipid asymmetry ATPase subunit MlaF